MEGKIIQKNCTVCIFKKKLTLKHFKKEKSFNFIVHLLFKDPNFMNPNQDGVHLSRYKELVQRIHIEPKGITLVI